MSRKNALLPVHFIKSQSMTGSSSSAPQPIQWVDNVSIQLNFTGTPTGVFQVLGSLDYSPGGPVYPIPANAGNFVPITLPTVPVASGAAGQILLDLNQLSFPWIKVVYTPSGGAGTLDGYISTKEV